MAIEKNVANNSGLALQLHTKIKENKNTIKQTNTQKHILITMIQAGELKDKHRLHSRARGKK